MKGWIEGGGASRDKLLYIFILDDTWIYTLYTAKIPLRTKSFFLSPRNTVSTIDVENNATKINTFGKGP